MGSRHGGSPTVEEEVQEVDQCCVGVVEEGRQWALLKKAGSGHAALV
jgi:hypothetical protein